MHRKRADNPTAKRPKARNKENDALVQAAWDAGWCETVKKGYIHAKSPDRKTMVVIESTPGDHHCISNTRSRLKRAGVSV